MPPEILDSLAHNNYASPRPHPIDPSVVFDVARIRRLVDDATDLAVRAANGTTSSNLHNSLSVNRGIFGEVSTLGLGMGGAGGSASLSPERKHRMREVATQKLSVAYHLDEIAASVATMQSASALEGVAKLVLQRNPQNSDAKYVHFFHEKIPSRMLAECTNLSPLDDVIRDQRREGEPLRTRAIMKLFKEDFAGSTRDLSEGLALHRYTKSQHSAERSEMVLANALGAAERNTGRDQDRKYEPVLAPENQPRSLESQLLFQRAGVYLNTACQHIQGALEGQRSDHENSSVEGKTSQAQQEAQMRRLEAGKAVKRNAKRALRDYLSFLSTIDYTPGLPTEVAQAVSRRIKGITNNRSIQRSLASPHSAHNGNASNDIINWELVPRKESNLGQQPDDFSHRPGVSEFQKPQIIPVSSLFASSPAPGLPPYPSSDQALVLTQPTAPGHRTSVHIANYQEAITYHPLLTEALHSLLLTHALLQTSSKEMLRHAHNVARCARLCDGYPIFLAARSPARADWIEIIRRTNDWLGLRQSWESLCTPAPVPGQRDPANNVAQEPETEEQAREQRRQEAIMDALADERVHDEASFQAAVSVREVQAEADQLATGGANGTQLDPKVQRRWAQEGGKEYPITTNRAGAIARWIQEAPVTPGEGRTKRGGKKKQAQVKRSMQGLRINGHSLGKTDGTGDGEDKLD